uniref:DNA-binding protein BIN4 n=1 Tax=Lotharella oceanica TaxID=641309 RepID=A0A7S2TZZ1_9EUKA|mmetsp:Transcript_37631/g.69412  ORF Transcript_37631/g.69412 Transcript_37631/m.69412 type:complete len:245 (+) Transcript_37631:532-1266(+)
MSEESDFTPDDESDYEPAPKKKTPQTKKLTKRSQTKAKFSAKQEKASSETRKKKLTPKKNQIPTPQKNHVVKKREAKSPKKKDSAGSAIKSSTKKGKRETLEKIPLFLPKQQQAMLLIQIDEESMQLGGEVGAVGRLKASKRKGLKIDLKGHSYKGKFYQTAGSLAIVSVGPDEARLEAVSDSLVKLVHESSIFDSEKMLRGTLEAGDSQDVDFDVNEEWRKEEAEKKKKKRQEKAKKKRAAKA